MSDKEKACGLDLKAGLNGVKYKQDFVRAPMSLHPKACHERKANSEGLKSDVLKSICGPYYK